jgi:hypothetical protein
MRNSRERKEGSETCSGVLLYVKAHGRKGEEDRGKIIELQKWLNNSLP